MNVEQLRGTDHIIFESIVGSKLYGLSTPSSDTDIKGIYKFPLDIILKRNFQDQVSDDTNDQTFYEVGRFLHLATQANPNILELLYAPDEFILKSGIEYELIREHRDAFLTKSIKNSLGGYAISQIKRARGKNKKIVNPVDKERKSPLDFCYVINSFGTIPIKRWLEDKGNTQEEYGVSNLDKAHNVYKIFHNQGIHDFRGILKPGAGELRMSSIPKEMIYQYYVMYYASESYSTYCKDYKEYWEWMKNRNESRYVSVEKHNKGYDGKHLMHCFRLLNMGIDAANEGTLIVKRPDSERQWLLDVREGKFEYDYLIGAAEEKLKAMEDAIDKSDLPDTIDDEFVDQLLVDLRLK